MTDLPSALHYPSVLDQGTAYDSLHWNESVAEFYKEEKARESTANTDTMSRWSSEINVAESRRTPRFGSAD